MTPEEAISYLRRYGYFIAHDSSKVEEALNMAIEALTRENETRQMLEAEKNKAYCRSKDYRSGRISAFYDALGVNYAD